MNTGFLLLYWYSTRKIKQVKTQDTEVHAGQLHDNRMVFVLGFRHVKCNTEMNFEIGNTIDSSH